MKNIYLALIVLFIIGCGSDEGGDCNVSTDTSIADSNATPISEDKEETKEVTASNNENDSVSASEEKQVEQSEDALSFLSAESNEEVISMITKTPTVLVEANTTQTNNKTILQESHQVPSPDIEDETKKPPTIPIF